MRHNRDDSRATKAHAGGGAEIEAESAAQSWSDKHLGVLISGLAFVTVAAKILVVAHGVPTTAAAIVKAEGVGNTALGSLMVGLPLAAGLLLIGTTAFLGEAVREKDPLVPPVVLYLVVLVLCAMIVPWEVLSGLLVFSVGTILLGFPYGAYLRWSRRRKGRPDPPASSAKSEFRSMGVVLAALLWLITVGTDTPWLPAERFKVADQGDPLVGYLLGNDEKWSTILRHEDRQIVRLPVERIAERRLCVIAGGTGVAGLIRPPTDQRSLVARLAASPKAEYPRC